VEVELGCGHGALSGIGAALRSVLPRAVSWLGVGTSGAVPRKSPPDQWSSGL